MRINYNEIIESVEKEAVKQTIQRLKEEGFQVKKDFRINNVFFDLYAEKENEKRLYEFKVRKETFKYSSKEKERYVYCQAIAKQIGAKLLFIFVKPPKDGVSVFIDSLEEIIFGDIYEKGRKQLELLKFNSPIIQNIYDVQLKTVSIYKGYTLVIGQCFADVETIDIPETIFNEHPNLNDINNNDILVDFELRLDNSLSVINSEYKFYLGSQIV